MYKSIVTHNRRYTCRISHHSLIPKLPIPLVQYPAVVVYEPVTVTSGGAAKVVRSFESADFSGGLTLAGIPAGSMILSTIVEIIESFDAPGTLTIGTQSAQGILMTTNEVNLASQAIYERTNYLQIDSFETFKAFFSGSPTVGSGKIIIIYI